MTRRFRHLLLALLPFLPLACGGGSEQPKTYPVSGTVTLDGKPIAEGRIAFRGKDHPATGGVISNGKFECQSHPGPMTVEIRAFKSVKRQTPVAGMSDTEEVNYIPVEYNSESKLKADIATGPTVVDFAITSR